MKLTDRLKECSYLWILYIIIGIMLAFVIGVAIYLFIIGFFTFYYMNNELLTLLTQSYVKFIFIGFTEFIFITLVIRGLYKETGDTVLIDIMKHGDSTMGCTLMGSVSFYVAIKDITVNTKDSEIAVGSLLELKNYTNLERGYIRFKTDLVNDICFISELKVLAEDEKVESSTDKSYVLEINRYRYSGFKLLGKHEFNVFTLRDREENEIVCKEEQSKVIGRNSYVDRLYHAGVYNYPISFSKDLQDGFKNSKWSLGIIVVCCTLLFGIYGWYRNYSVTSFISNFREITAIDGIDIYTDADNYEYYSTYAKDAIQMLPEKMKKQFISEGWCLVFATNDLSTYEILRNTVEPGAVSGCTLPFYKLIVVRVPNNTRESSKFYVMETVCHEFGHFLALKGMGLTEQWREIYDKDRRNYLNDYAQSGASEGFACAYASYILYPEVLKGNTPDTFNYIKRILNNYLAS